MNRTDSIKNVKILYVTALSESADAFLMSHFKALLDEGYEVALACSEDKIVSEILNKESRLKYFSIPVPQGISIKRDIASIFRFYKILKQFSPHILHAHMSKASFLAISTGLILRIPARVYHNHGMALFSAKGASRQLLKIIERVTCFAATHIIFCSESTRSHAIQMRICNQRKSLVLGKGTISGIADHLFLPNLNESERNATITSLNIPSTKYYALFVGRIVNHKGISHLISAWKSLSPATKKDWTLIFAGSNDNDALASDLHNLCASDSNACYVGFCNNIGDYYSIANLLVLPSFHEGFPYSVLEAQAAGIPAVVTNVTGNIDAVQDGITGLLAQPKDTVDLTRVLGEAMTDNKNLAKMGETARQRGKRYFSEKEVLSNLITFYKDQLIPIIK